MLEVRLLGEFEVRLDDHVVELPSRPAQLLLSYIILHPGIEHPRARLAGVLWPEASESNARNNLRQALWRIRRALGVAKRTASLWIVASPSGIEFVWGSDCWLDAAVLENEAGGILSTEELQEIVSLYRGELLPGFYEDWVVLTRTRLHAAFERKMQMLMEKLVQEGRWPEVLTWGERWISLGEAPEPAFRAMMVAHGSLGDTSGVGAVFQRCRLALREQLGVDPSEETTTLYARLIRREGEAGRTPPEPARSTSAPAPLRPRPRPFPLPASGPAGDETRVFVERREQLDKLHSELQEALSGRGRVALISGEAGSGKTWLVQEFARQAQDSHPDLLLVTGNCSSVTGLGDPLLPFREILRQLTGDFQSVWSWGAVAEGQATRLWLHFPETVEALLAQAPDLMDTLVASKGIVARGEVVDPERLEWLAPLMDVAHRHEAGQGALRLEQKDLFGQMTRFLSSIAQHRGLMLVLDDMQWADPGSIGMLFHMGRRISDCRILIVGAYRADELARHGNGQPHPLSKVVAELKRAMGDIEIDLTAATEAEARRFLDTLLDSEPNRLDSHFRAALFHRTAGHPLFIVELLRDLQERGDLSLDSQERWVVRDAIDWERLPARVEGVLEERIARLDDAARSLLSVASVQGEVFIAEVAARMAGLDERGAFHSLADELDRRHRLVQAQGLRRVGGERLSSYRFRHTLLAQFLYRRLSNPERARLHEEAGVLLEELFRGEVEDVAHSLARHFGEAGIVPKAVEYLRISGDRAHRMAAYDEAIDRFRRGIDLVRTLPPAPESAHLELGLQISMGAPLIVTRGFAVPEVQETILRARELSSQVHDVTQLFSVMHGLRSYYQMQGDHRVARAIATQLLDLALGEGSLSLELGAREALGSTLFYMGELLEANEELEKAIALYDREKHHLLALRFGQDPGVASLGYSALTLWCLGSWNRSLDRSQEAVQLAQRTEHAFSHALALDIAALLHAMRRESGAAQACAQRAIDISTKNGFPLWLALGTILLGWALTQEGEIEAGLTHLHAGISSWESTGAALGRPLFLALLAEGLSSAGQAREALGVVAQALQAVDRSEERVYEADLHRLWGDLLVQLSTATAEPEARYREALSLARRQGAKGVELRVAIRLCQMEGSSSASGEAEQALLRLVESFEPGTHAPEMELARRTLKASA